MRGLRLAAAAAIGLAIAAPAAARAQVDLFSGETVSGIIDLRVGAGEGERTWTRGGYGKTLVGGDAGGGWRGAAEVANASVAWKPRVGWAWSGVVSAQFQPGQKHEVDLVEAYLSYKPVPTSPVRISARAGLFWPHISMEHGDPFWGVSYGVTPSAINSWVGEEVKVLGLEGTVSAPFLGSTLVATAGVFGANDTAGTLLALRGWALHDRKTGAFSVWPLPELDTQYARIWRGQAPDTEPTRHDLDDRAGFYGRLEWRPPAPFTANLFYYDNRADPAVVESGQWGWRTRFWNAGASWRLDDRTQVMAQAMWGTTLEGRPTPQGLWINVGYASAYLLATRRIGGADRLTARFDYFKTRDRTWQARDNNNEKGWAQTVAWRRDVSDHVVVLTEAMHVASNRFARAYQRVPREQDQFVLQSSIRLMF